MTVVKLYVTAHPVRNIDDRLHPRTGSLQTNHDFCMYWTIKTILTSSSRSWRIGGEKKASKPHYLINPYSADLVPLTPMMQSIVSILPASDLKTSL